MPTTFKKVWVLDHPPTEQFEGPVYHSSDKCPMVIAYSGDYDLVPFWIVKQAGIRCCTRTGPCRAITSK